MFSKPIVTIVLVLVGSEIGWQVWKKWYRKKPHVEEDEDTTTRIAEVLMFSDQSIYCRDHANSRKPCGKNMCAVANVNRLIHYMNSSKKTLTLSMYIVTCHDVVDATIRAQKRNVIVRAIIDTSMAGNSVCGDQIERMRRAGVKIKIHGTTSSLMHHKFAIIDDQVMIYGSTNWTMQAFYGNFDSILITNDKFFVKQFINEFDKMWSGQAALNFPGRKTSPINEKYRRN